MEYKVSIFDKAKDEIGKFLSEIDCAENHELLDGMITFINMVSDYHEEGSPLFPDIMIVDNKEILDSIVGYKVRLCENEVAMNSYEFGQIVKMCAPLAVDGWIIYVIIKDNGKMEYGVLSSEVTVMSLSVYEQTVVSGTGDTKTIYIRNVGNKVVEVSSEKSKILISLNLTPNNDAITDSINKLVDIILQDTPDGGQIEWKNYFVKTILTALNEGHGNLIAIVEDKADVIKSIKDNFNGGTLLAEQFDLASMMLEIDPKDVFTSNKLRAYTTLLKSMLNFDGITLFSTTGKVMGYHYIVNNNDVPDEPIQGGSRTRAYHALKAKPFVRACFMKSQDGKLKLDIK